MTRRSRRRRSSGAANLLLSCISIALTLLALEVGLRLKDGVPLWPLENLVTKRVDLLRIHTLNIYDSTLGWVLQPNWSNHVADLRESFTTGDFGVRMNQAEIKPLPHGGILAVGDSFTAGSEVGDTQTWPAHLERTLDRPVINAAAGGWGTDQIVLRAESLFAETEPRLVVVSYLINDILRANYRVWGGGQKPYFLVDAGALVPMNSPVPRYDGALRDVGYKRGLFGYSYLVSFVMERIGYSFWWEDQMLQFRTVSNDPALVSCLLLQRLQASIAKRDAHMLFIQQYGGDAVIHETAPPDYALRVLACARAAGVETLDTWPLLRAVADGPGGEAAFQQLFVMHENNRVYGHMSDAGNAFIADRLAERIRALGW